MNGKIRVLLADDKQMFREGLRQLLASEPGVEVVGDVADGHSAVKMAAELSPDVIVMDITMPDLNGMEATRQVVAGGRDAKVIALSVHNESRIIEEMLRAGAAGYVLKDEAYDVLAAAVRIVVQNKIYLCPRAAEVVANGFAHGDDSDGGLSSRERQILQQIAEGKSNKQVAAELSLSIKTIETHRRNMMEKLKLDSVAAITKYAIREGITSVDD